MASVDKRPDGHWRARWREYPGGPQRARHFDRKLDAERWLVKQQHDLLTGAYVDPAAAKVTVAAFAATWLQRMGPTWRVTTAALVQRSIVRHVVPVLGHRSLSSLRRSDVEALYASLPLAPSTVATVHQHLSQLLTAAVEDGLLARNPATRARLPRTGESKAQPVALETVERISAELPEWCRVIVPLALGAGLRQSETTGLTLDRVDFLRRTLRVDRQLDRTGRLVEPKTPSSHRTIPLASIVGDALAAHLYIHPAEPGQLLVRTPAGLPLDMNRFGHWWRKAAKEARAEGVRYHDLRHTFASMLLSRGVSVKAVADWLGHASPVVTLTTYAHLMPADEDVARTVLDAALAQPAEDLLRTARQLPEP